MIDNKDIITLIKKASKKIGINELGSLILVTEKQINSWISGKPEVPKHMRTVIKKHCDRVLDAKITKNRKKI